MREIVLRNGSLQVPTIGILQGGRAAEKSRTATRNGRIVDRFGEKVCSLSSHIVDVSQDAACELTLQSKVPRLDVRRVVPGSDRAADAQPERCEQALRTPGWQLRAIGQGIRNAAIGRGVVVLIGQQK